MHTVKPHQGFASVFLSSGESVYLFWSVPCACFEFYHYLLGCVPVCFVYFLLETTGMEKCPLMLYSNIQLSHEMENIGYHESLYLLKQLQDQL